MELLAGRPNRPRAVSIPGGSGSPAGRPAHNGYDRAQSIKPLVEERLPGPEDDKARKRAEDVALLARIVERDERAVEELYARYSGPLYSLAYQVTGAGALRTGRRPGGVHRPLARREPVRSGPRRRRALAVLARPPQGHRPRPARGERPQADGRRRPRAPRRPTTTSITRPGSPSGARRSWPRSRS